MRRTLFGSFETINEDEFLLEAIGTKRRANWINLVESILAKKPGA